MRTKALAIIAIVLGSLALGFLCSRAEADTTETATVTLSPDGGVEVGDVVPLDAPPATTKHQPSDDITNPVDDPLAAIDDARQAKKQGWSLFLLCLLVMTAAGLSRACERWPDKPVLQAVAKNKTILFVIACVGAMAAAAYNAAFVGGSPYALLYAAGGALLLFIAPKPKAAQ